MGRGLSEIIQSVGIHTSSFFQGAEHFTFLSESLVSDLKAGASLGRKRQVRLWSAACSTGEEAYSIAIALLEGFRNASSPEQEIDQPQGWQIEVVASDSDAAMLAVAEDRIYTEEALSAIPERGKKRYFLKGRGAMTGQARVKKGVADLVHFHHFDLKAGDWPVEAPFEVIFFRVALADLAQEMQEFLLRRMLCYLTPHGYLILGPSASVPWLKDAVLPAGKNIYQLRPHGRAVYTGKERRPRPREQRRIES